MLDKAFAFDPLEDDSENEEQFKNSLKKLDPPRILITPSPDDDRHPIYKSYPL
jgi:hypothetical protein